MLRFVMVLFGLLCVGGACLFLDVYGLFVMVAVVGAVVIAMLMTLQMKQEKLEEKLDRLLEERENPTDSE